MKQLLKYLLGGSVALLACMSCESSKIGDQDNPKEAEMQAIAQHYLSDVVYPIYLDLANETQALYEALNNAHEKGVDNITDADVDNICDIFLQARKSWEESEAFLYGAATDFGIDPHIDTWPLDLEGLATALGNKSQFDNLVDENGHIGDDQIAYAANKLGQELLGFHGIEFIIFREGRNRTAAELRADESDAAFSVKAVSGRQELAYATAVAGDLRDRVYQLCVAWNPDAPAAMREHVEDGLELPTTVGSGDKTYGENMLNATKAGSTYATWQEVMSTILVAGCSNICNEVANVKMGNAHSGEDVNYIESPYSKKSFQDYRDNILSICYSLYGKSLASEPQQHSLLSFIEKYNSSLAQDIENAIDASLKALDDAAAKGAFADIYADPLVQVAMDKVNELDTQLNKAAAWIVLQ